MIEKIVLIIILIAVFYYIQGKLYEIRYSKLHKGFTDDLYVLEVLIYNSNVSRAYQLEKLKGLLRTEVGKRCFLLTLLFLYLTIISTKNSN